MHSNNDGEETVTLSLFIASIVFSLLESTPEYKPEYLAMRLGDQNKHIHLSDSLEHKQVETKFHLLPIQYSAPPFAEWPDYQ